MKIFSVADIHGNQKIYSKIKELVIQKKIDVLILPGDLYPKPNAVTFETFNAIQRDSVQQMDELFKDLEIPIYYLLGNDDWVEDGIHCGINLHGRLEEYEGVYFTGFQYVRKTGYHTNRELSEDKIQKNFKEQVESLKLNHKKPLVLVGHTPLYLLQDKILNSEHVGSRKLRIEIEKLRPIVYLCGHIHEDFGMNTLHNTFIFNCACQYEINLLRGYIIEIKNGNVLHYEAVIQSC